ncbi:bZIP transcription factor 11-like [Salvia splendens]|uniref:bZIP transcription factor 11-like n=1 Tax=Salvia splendens TaxID=180675 RepID=UPI001C273945|nr:bZIP transcription factor 11-like [Salvia splendens]
MKMDSSACSSSDVQQRKQRRMESNRESARLSRVKKQKYMDDLTAEVAHLSKLNNQISKSIVIKECSFQLEEARLERSSVSSAYRAGTSLELAEKKKKAEVGKQCVKIEAHNLVLRAQIMDLSHTLHSLKQILTHHAVFEPDHLNFAHALFNNSWNLLGDSHH